MHRPRARHLPVLPTGASIAVLLVALAAGAGPAVVSADTGAVMTFLDLVRASNVVALVVIKEAPPEAPAWTIEIQRAYRGTEPGTLTIEPFVDDPDFRAGERWLLLTSNLGTLDVRAGLFAFRVDPDGAIEAKLGVIDAPATVADLDALFGPATAPAPTVAPGPGDVTPRDPEAAIRDALPEIAFGFVLAVLAAFLGAAWVARRIIADRQRNRFSR